MSFLGLTVLVLLISQFVWGTQLLTKKLSNGAYGEVLILFDSSNYRKVSQIYEVTIPPTKSMQVEIEFCYSNAVVDISVSSSSAGPFVNETKDVGRYSRDIFVNFTSGVTEYLQVNASLKQGDTYALVIYNIYLIENTSNATWIVAGNCGQVRLLTDPQNSSLYEITFERADSFPHSEIAYSLCSSTNITELETMDLTQSTFPPFCQQDFEGPLTDLAYSILKPSSQTYYRVIATRKQEPKMHAIYNVVVYEDASKSLQGSGKSDIKQTNRHKTKNRIDFLSKK